MSERRLAGSPEWLKQQTTQFSRVAPALESYATELRRILQSAAGDLAPLAIVQVRTKSPASFAQKALKKQREHDCPTHQFTDLCGGRVIVRTRREVEAISHFVESFFDIDWANSVDTSRRLEPTEFGYRSIHYIVSLNREDHGDGVPDEVFGFECGICQQRYPLKAEIQVRTMVEHAWSDFSHDISYKGAFELPTRFRREIALIAAELEDVDQSFDRVEGELRIYAADYGAHLDIDQLRERMAQIQMVLDIDPTNAKLGWEIGKLAIAADDPEQARRLFEPFVDDDNPEGAYQPRCATSGNAVPDSRGRPRAPRVRERPATPRHRKHPRWLRRQRAVSACGHMARYRRCHSQRSLPPGIRTRSDGRLLADALPSSMRSGIATIRPFWM